MYKGGLVFASVWFQPRTGCRATRYITVYRV